MLALAAGAFAVSLVRADDSVGLPLASLVVALWAGLAIAISHCFAAPPPELDTNAGWFARFRHKLKLGFLWLLALASIGALGLVAMLSSRAINLLLD